MQKILEIPYMNFNGQPNMIFGMFISFTCDSHLKLDILNPLNIIFLSNGLKNESITLQPFPPKFQDFKLFNLVFHQVHPMKTCTFIKGNTFLLYKKFEINCMILCLLFYYLYIYIYIYIYNT